MKIGDLVKWHSVKNDNQDEFDTDFGIILEFMQCYDSSSKEENAHKALVQFYDEAVWLSIHSIQVINEQKQEII
jgi:hypothetical protein